MSREGYRTEIQLEKSKIWYDKTHRIIRAEFNEQAEFGIEDARACTAAMFEVTGGVARPLFVDFTNVKSQTKECRDYFAKDPEHIKTYSAVAILVTSPLSRVIANFFMGLNKPLRPTRLFTEEAQAIAWLVTQSPATP